MPGAAFVWSQRILITFCVTVAFQRQAEKWIEWQQRHVCFLTAGSVSCDCAPLPTWQSRRNSCRYSRKGETTGLLCNNYDGRSESWVSIPGRDTVFGISLANLWTVGVSNLFSKTDQTGRGALSASYSIFYRDRNNDNFTFSPTGMLWAF